ncbi:MAG: sigma-54-dependent Fis family transcriptional regulator [Ectothiorhodospiraceae bacterium]|nr:sigma-54-dependent Fis family transcriptional regulator [Planctomycetota bacterium]MCP5154253.1 sigma-54-dependent Fis family transcriptional regulator [Ectothiorhodospiraceae bacterium]
MAGNAVLVVEDEDALARNIKTYLERHGYAVTTAGSAEEGLARAETFRPDVVVMDYMLPGRNGIDALGELRARDPEVKVLLVTGQGSVQVAVDAMKAGASDYLSKPVVLKELKLLIDKLLDQRRVDSELSYYRSRESGGDGVDALLGESPAMRRLKDDLARLLAAERGMRDGIPPSVLVTGETGTGKELVARALHFGGSRAQRPFIEFNCAAMPASLVEAELIGYERGAFTDASQRKLGLVEAADGGTLFLDEVASLELGVQAKLLKLLEDRVVRRLGGLREQRVDVRFVAAANEDMEQAVREGRFRADLFFRLRIVHLQVPPLRAREGDILLLARHFLDQHARRYGRSGLRFSPAAESLLVRYPWPGNVREMRNAIEHVVLMASGDLVDTSHLTFCQVPEGSAETRVSPGGSASDAEGFNLEQMERSLVERALRHTDGNVSRAARLLGVSRDTLRYRIEKYGIHLP